MLRPNSNHKQSIVFEEDEFVKVTRNNNTLVFVVGDKKEQSTKLNNLAVKKGLRQKLTRPGNNLKRRRQSSRDSGQQ